MLQEELTEKAVVDLENFCKRYSNVMVLDDLIFMVEEELRKIGKCLKGETRYSLKEAVAVLIDNYGYDRVSDEVLEHNP